ncbi:hypothetical protein G3570_09755 [Balneolaceae bacterium YR4-1]|uniref:VWA domain-containing protein n=1 Tax=Halalkalibaculum roseum TaxID=2709311 RepID=A0A6M1SXE4_9BACT|nr:hypothetical protein [Halalkalibaculum roseum]NGP76918.1 hypothetical protein [Halalkalibaculum roseum]
MRANLYYGFLVLLIGSLYLTACDNATSGSDNFGESIQLYTDLEPVPGASNTTAIVNRGDNVKSNFGNTVGANSWFQIKLKNIEKNSFINNGTMGAWCLEWKKPLDSNNDVHEGTKIYSTKGAAKWAPMNYFFSIKNDLIKEDPGITSREIQSVVWSLAGYIGIAPEFDITKLSNNELPARLFDNGQLKVDKNKVVTIVEKVKNEYNLAKFKSEHEQECAVVETNGDQQDVIGCEPPPVIDVNTNIYIYFDDSGSMDRTLAPLETMRDQQLKEALLPLYDGNGTEYDNRVQVITWCDFTNCERTFKVANLEGAAPPANGNIVVLIFQDEAQTTYHPSTSSFDPNAGRSTNFDTDITDLRNRLDTWATTEGTNYYRSVIFQVDGYPGFKSFIESVQNGVGNYAVPYGLSDRNEFNYVYDVVDGDTPETYRDLIIAALEDLGFDLSTP